MMARLVELNPAGVVVGAILWDDPEHALPPDEGDGRRYLPHAEAVPGWRLVDGVLSPPIVTADARRADLLDAVDALAAAKMAAGYPHDFGAPYGVQVLQNRDGDDRTNWLSVASTANLMIAMNRGGDPCGSLRTEANVNVPVTAAQAAATLVAMQAYLGGFLARAWALKDQIRAAADADLDAIDITAGWPGQEAA